MDQALLFSQMEQSVAKLESYSERYFEILRWWNKSQKVQHCSLHLYSADTNRLTHVVSLGLPQDFIDATYHFTYGEGCAGRAAQSGMLVNVPDLSEERSMLPLLAHGKALGFHSVWAVPITWENRLLGTITVYQKESQPMSKHEQYLHLYAAQSVARVLHHAIDIERNPTLAALQMFREGAASAQALHAVRKVVLESWQRCKTYFNDQVNMNESPTLSSQQLVNLRQNNLTLLRAFRQYVTSLFQQVQDLDCAVLLCDPDGWLIEVMGNPRYQLDLHKLKVKQGQNISERFIGNSSIGTALATRQAVYFDSYEHYFPEMQSWSSAGSPILLDDGTRMIGAFAFTVPDKQVDVLIPPLVQSAAIAIANWMQLEEYRQDAVRVHQSVISQSDYHLIFVDTNQQVTDERHPIPLTDDIRQSMVQVTKRGECSQCELQLGEQTYLVDVRNLWDHTGHMKGTLGLFRDVTQHKRLELKVQDAEKLSVLTSLAAGIAHEIRNPLTTARGFLQLFSRQLQSDTDKRFMEITIQELDRINQLVKDFMSLAKPETPSFEQVNLTEVLHSVIEFIKPEASLCGVKLSVQIPDDEIVVWAEANQLKQVVLNVIQNALHACTNKNDVVEVELRTIDVENTSVEIVIADTGKGMTKSQLDRLFEPFYTTKAAGTGLGMAISKRIVDEHRGRISVTSEVDVGTTVQIQLGRMDPSLPLSEWLEEWNS